MRLVVLDGYTMNPTGDNPWDALNAFGEVAVYDRTPIECLEERAAGAEILITNKTPLRADFIAAQPKLRCICVLAAGYDVVDIKAAAEHGIPVCNTPAYSVESVALHVFALLLELCRHTALHDASVKNNTWSQCPDFCYWLTPQLDLYGKTLGIVGFGSIGRRVAELGHAFGMHILAHSRTMKNAPSYTPFEFVDNVNDLFARSDIVSLHAPLTEETRCLVNARRLALMPQGAILINTARGALVDEEAVAAALHDGHLGGFGTDVLSKEPPAATNPLLKAPRSLITPHIAWASLQARRNIMRITVDNIKAFLNNQPIHVVNAKWLALRDEATVTR